MSRQARTTPRYYAVQGVTGLRMIAALIDVVPLLLLFIVLSDLVGGNTDTAPAGEDGYVYNFNGLPLVIYLFLVCAYYFLMELKTGGQTIGKKVLKLRVVTVDGRPLTPAKVAIRTLLRLVDWLPAFYFVGYVAAIASPLKQRLGDRAAGTIVVRT